MSTKRKLTAKLGQPALKPSAKLPGKSAVDESRAVVLDTAKTANGVVEISDSSSAEEEEEDEEEGASEEEEDEAEDQEAEQDESESPAEAADISMDDAPEEDENQEPAEPSLGDLVRAQASEPIDVAGAFDAPSPSNRKAVQVPAAPSGASLGTVLAQALRTNDVALLESCLHTTDTQTIRATIQRLDSALAGALLQKLAERLHRRPGRAGSLMGWVQWTLVTHGGYLATQRDLVKKLADLNRVIDERAKGLQSLLSLKGKLDMLEAQIELRRAMQGARGLGDEDEEDEDVIYVEGQESEEEGGEEEGSVRKPKRLAQNGDLEDISDGESNGSEDVALTNGKAGNSEDEGSESSEDDDEDDLIDDEAEETDDDDAAGENEVDHDDQDEEVEDEESDDAGAPPPKMQRTGLSRKR